MRTTAIVVAAGRGTRMQSPTAKAFVPLGGIPMLVYSLRTLSSVPSVEAIVLVVPQGQRRSGASVLRDAGPWRIPVVIIPGGPERQDSVAAGLARVSPTTEFVIVHDAARPFVTPDCVQRCLAAAAADGAAVAALPVRDTVKVVDAAGRIERTLDRRRVWLAQTPQVFRAQLLRQAYASARHDAFAGTDDAALVERLGVPVRAVEGDPDNRKLTTPEDLRWAERHLLAHPPGR